MVSYRPPPKKSKNQNDGVKIIEKLFRLEEIKTNKFIFKMFAK